MVKARRGRYAGHHFFVNYDYARSYFRAAKDADDEGDEDGAFTNANTYERDSIYNDPFDKEENEEDDDFNYRSRRQ
jgi:hypothetical protein